MEVTISNHPMPVLLFHRIIALNDLAGIWCGRGSSHQPHQPAMRLGECPGLVLGGKTLPIDSMLSPTQCDGARRCRSGPSCA